MISIDQEKAFDKVDREFLNQIMRKLGYSEMFIKFIKKLYETTLSIISNNGFLSTPFSLSRGIRQQCPLSLLLYIINGKVINLNIKNNEKIVGYPIPNQKENTKLSQYADDTTLFVLTEQSIIETLNFFEKYNLATRATINISKTTITTLANAKIYNIDKKIQNVKINDSQDFVARLGIYFTKDLRTTGIYNWNICLTQSEKQAQQLSRRQLSLRGKTILLNSLISSKLTFTSNVFPVPTTLQQKIESKIFKYIWQFHKTEPIARKTLFLSKHQGGIGLIHPQYHSLAMRLKHFLKLKEKTNQETWIILTRYNLASMLYCLYKNFKYMISNNTTKTEKPNINFYYEDIIIYLQKQNAILELPRNSQKIYKQIIQNEYRHYIKTGQSHWNQYSPQTPWNNL